MRKISNGTAPVVLALTFLSIAPLMAQMQELGLTLGGLRPLDRQFSGGTLKSKSGVALQANYAIRLVEGGAASLYLETHFLASR
jgi:hypothetical protein